MKNEKKLLKKRCRKNYAKNIGKTSKKSSKIDAKTIKKPSKNRFKKKVEKQRSGPATPGNPGKPAAPVRVTKRPTERQQKEDNPKERNSERSMQRDQPRPFNTPRAPSGPERIYLSSGCARVSGENGRRPPDTGSNFTGYWSWRDPWAQGGVPWGPRGPRVGPEARLWRAIRSSLYIYIYIYKNICSFVLLDSFNRRVVGASS